LDSSEVKNKLSKQTKLHTARRINNFNFALIVVSLSSVYRFIYGEIENKEVLPARAGLAKEFVGTY